MRVRSTRKTRRRTAFLALAPLMFATGCEKEVQDEFRSAAAGALQTGFSAIFDGILDGVFAVIEPNEPVGSEAGPT